MHINACERRHHITGTNRLNAELNALTRGIANENIVGVRPCGDKPGKCWVITESVSDTRENQR